MTALNRILHRVIGGWMDWRDEVRRDGGLVRWWMRRVAERGALHEDY